ncbi:MAG: NHL repeat-containing protein, partial [Candidatus Korobacteraceae bacterium]
MGSRSCRFCRGAALMFSVLLLGSALPVGAVEPPATAHFSYAQVILGGSPSAGLLLASTALRVAVDGSGNVFVADPNDSAVKEIPSGCLTSSCVQTLGGGFSAPFGVAVDGSGNVFVADTSNNAVKEIPPGCTASSCVITLAAAYTSGGGFSAPSGVAVDGSGNVFVADNGNSAVKEILAAGGYTTVNTLAGGFSYPEDVAVDGSGNLFVADTGNHAVEEIVTAGGYTTVNALASGFNFPRGVAVDGSGNVFVADDGNNSVEEILAAGGYTMVNTLASGFNQPYGVAVDGSGNIFVADSGNNRVLELETAGANFGTVAIGQTSATISLVFTIDSRGTMGSPVALTQGAAGLDFAVANTGTCTTGAYNAGDTCTVDVTFTPSVAGLRNGAVLLEDLDGNTIATGYVHGIGSGPQ